MSKNNFYPAVYEINTRVWFNKFRAQGAKSLLDIPDEYWRDLRSKGIDYVWLMGIWKTCSSVIDKYCFEEGLIKSYDYALKDWSRNDVIGSPYAIDSYQINPLFGGADTITKLKEKLNEAGLKLILDYIQNHFSAHSSLVKSKPEIFLAADEESFHIDSHTFFHSYKNSETYFAHGRDPFFPAWQDTIQVNYFSNDYREFSKETLLALSKLCDGVRCDMAMLALNNVFKNTWVGVLNKKGFSIPSAEYWGEVISAVKKEREDFLFIAEAYWDLEWDLQSLGFDFTYDKKLTDRIKFATSDEIRDHLRAEEIYQRRSIRFLENHDEERAAAVLGKEKTKAAAVIMSSILGMKLYYDGQFDGKKIRLPLQLGREAVEPGNLELNKFYCGLLSITARKIFKYGNWKLLEIVPAWQSNNSYKNMLVWQWDYEEEKVLVAVNYANAVSTCRAKIDIENYPEEFELKDLLHNKKYLRSAEEVFHSGLFIELKPWQAHIFNY